MIQPALFRPVADRKLLEQQVMDELFEKRWKRVPAYAYDLELKDLYQNFYEMGWMDGRANKDETTKCDVADQ